MTLTEKFSNKYLTMLIIDDFLPKVKFKELSTFVMSNEFPWFYSTHVSLPPEDQGITDEYAFETDGFYHMLYADEINYHGMFFEKFLSFFNKCSEQFGYTQEDLIRARLGLKQPKVGYKVENYNLPHVDYTFPHDTIIYYLNDSDGDTRIFNQHAATHPDAKSFSVQQTIEPKANRLVLFDGCQYHTASNPMNVNRRIVLNVNLKCK